MAWTPPGLVAGTLVLRMVPEPALEVLVALAVLAAVALRLHARPRPRTWSHARSAATAVTSGVLSTSTGIQAAGRRLFAALYGERYEHAAFAVLALTALVAIVAAIA